MTNHANADHGAAGARLAHRLLLAGALAVLGTCAAYVLAGPVAALPGGAASVELARAATPAAAPWMRLASLFGVPGDLLLAVAGLMLALSPGQRPAAVTGWLGLGLVGLVFLVVDTMVGFMLPPLAVLDGEAAYAGARALFDALFLAGTAAGGASALGLTWGGAADSGLSQAAWWSMRAAGALALFAGAAGLFGWAWPHVVGASVTWLVLVLAAWGWSGRR
ncbi:MAG: hypothetical protein U1F53_01825 [Burkholderiaceae bacterium]